MQLCPNKGWRFVLEESDEGKAGLHVTFSWLRKSKHDCVHIHFAQYISHAYAECSQRNHAPLRIIDLCLNPFYGIRGRHTYRFYWRCTSTCVLYIILQFVLPRIYTYRIWRFFSWIWTSLFPQHVLKGHIGHLCRFSVCMMFNGY